MKRLFISAALASAVLGAGATPVLAQPYRAAAVAPGQDLWGQLDQLEARLQSGIADGSIDRGESSRALGEIASIRHEAQDLRDRHGGRLGEDDRLRLQARLDHLSRSIHWMREHGERGGPVARDDYGWGAGRWDHDRFWTGAPAGPYERIGWLRARIQHAADAGELDRGQTHRAFGDLRAIIIQADRLTARDGGRLNGPDAAYLQDRLDRLSRGLRWAEHRDR